VPELVGLAQTALVRRIGDSDRAIENEIVAADFANLALQE